MKTRQQFLQLKNLFSYSRDYKRRIYKACLFSVLNKVLDLFPPVLIGLAVDTVVKAENSFLAQLGGWDQFEQLTIIGIFTVFIWGLESYYEYLYSVHWKTLAQLIQHKIRMETYAHLQRLDTAYFESQQSGDMIAIVNDDVNQLERFLDVGINELIQVAVTVGVIGAIYFYKSPYLAAMSFITMPLIVYGSIWFQKFLTPLYLKVRDQVGLLTSELNNNLQGMITIKSFAREDESHSKINDLSRGYFSANEKAIHVSSLFTPLIRMLVMVGFLMTLLIGGKLTLEGQIEVGTYSVLIFLIQRLLWPLTRLGQTLDLFQRAMASVHRIFRLLHTPIKIQNGSFELPPSEVTGRLSFSRVNFSYHPGHPVLKDFNLTIEPGESLGLVGSTGSGKSSLIKLIQRLYEPDSGEILLDNRPLGEYTFKSLRSSIALVSQDVYLFHGSVIENLRFAQPEASNEQVYAACRQALIHDFILSLPQGYNTLVGERGQRLSGGQKQRLSIARALLAEAPIVILDEATSAVDNVTESQLQLELKTALKGKTSIIIAHRLSTVVSCDRIIVMTKGKIEEEGPHTKLSKNNGTYASLWKVQAGLK